MNRTRDELVGVVDLFGALTREELAEALFELAFKQGRDVDENAVEAEIAAAEESYYLVAFDRDGERLLAPGPASFPTLPENAEDLPHILDVESRAVDREALAGQVLDRLVTEVEEAVAADDRDRAEELLDASYDLEAWAPVDAAGVRDRLDAVLADD
jgi:hypothetical protein